MVRNKFHLVPLWLVTFSQVMLLYPIKYSFPWLRVLLSALSICWVIMYLSALAGPAKIIYKIARKSKLVPSIWSSRGGSTDSKPGSTYLKGKKAKSASKVHLIVNSGRPLQWRSTDPDNKVERMSQVIPLRRLKTKLKPKTCFYTQIRNLPSPEYSMIWSTVVWECVCPLLDFFFSSLACLTSVLQNIRAI